MTEDIQKTVPKGERIAKVIARSGVCSRRDAERLISEGRVQVNGKVITSAALNVLETDKIAVDEAQLKEAQTTRLYMFHKPVNFVTSNKDTKGRPTVFDLLPKTWPRLVSVGRLDVNSEGLLLLTNDGELARYLELPTTMLPRTYRVRVHGFVNVKRLESLKKGVTVDGVRYGPIEAALEEGGQTSSNAWLRVKIHEGKNREIRKVMAHLGLNVNRLIRLSYGPFYLDSLPKGRGVEVPIKNMRIKLSGFFGKTA